MIKKLLLKIPANYEEAKTQSVQIDQQLGFSISEVEQRLLARQADFKINDQQIWSHLSPQVWQTPYSEIREMIDQLDPQDGETWLDLGAGYGRMGIVLGMLRPRVKFVGYELVQERANEGQRIFEKLDLANCILKQADIAAADFELMTAEAYFIYDFGTRKNILAMLERLKEIAKKRNIRVIGRGRDIRQWIGYSHPWLSQVVEPVHFEHWSVYWSA